MELYKRSEYYCYLCNRNKIGDGFRVILECNALCLLRSQFLGTDYCYSPNTNTFCEITTSNSYSTVKGHGHNFGQKLVFMF